MRRSQALWNDLGCGEDNPYVCRRPCPTASPTPSPSAIPTTVPTFQPTITLPSPQFDFFDWQILASILGGLFMMTTAVMFLIRREKRVMRQLRDKVADIDAFQRQDSMSGQGQIIIGRNSEPFRLSV